MGSFNGDLTPLSQSPIKNIHMNSFTGDLWPLRNCPIQNIYMFSFNGDLTPLSSAPLRNVTMHLFKGCNLKPLKRSYRVRVDMMHYIDGHAFDKYISYSIGSSILSIAITVLSACLARFGY